MITKARQKQTLTMKMAPLQTKTFSFYNNPLSYSRDDSKRFNARACACVLACVRIATPCTY